MNQRHTCTFCRCRWPVAPPDKKAMEANHARVVRELRLAREALARERARR